MRHGLVPWFAPSREHGYRSLRNAIGAWLFAETMNGMYPGWLDQEGGNPIQDLRTVRDKEIERWNQWMLREAQSGEFWFRLHIAAELETDYVDQRRNQVFTIGSEIYCVFRCEAIVAQVNQSETEIIDARGDCLKIVTQEQELVVLQCLLALDNEIKVVPVPPFPAISRVERAEADWRFTF